MASASPTAQIVSDAPAKRGPKADDERSFVIAGADLTGIEGDAYGASTELVYLRDAIEDGASHDDDHDACLEAALLVPGLPPLARELIQRAQAADRREDAAIYERATERRHRAHAHTRSIAGRVELAVTARTRPDAICERDDPHPLALCSIGEES